MKGKRLFLAALSASAALLLAACGGGSGSAGSTVSETSAPMTGILPQVATGVPFQVFSSALSQTAVDQKRTVVARDADAWSSLWAEHAGAGLASRPVPPVDFMRNMVAGVYLGMAGACDTLSIDSVKKKEGPARIEVTWRHTPPAPNTVCVAAVVNHAVLITLPQSTLPVEFVQAAARPADELVIRTGWSFGMCLDNCEGTAEIRQDGASLRVSSRKDVAQPQSGTWTPVTTKEWEALVASFQTLPDVTVGCPDCADEGREWIEVEHKGSKKRLVTSCGAEVAGASEFQQGVRAIRGRLALALGLTTVCDPGRVEFERVTPSVFSSDITDKRFVAVRDAANWNSLWSEHSGGRAALPAIDFSTRMVAGVFMGRESVMCGSTSIIGVTQRSNPARIEVAYRVLDPGPNVMCIAVVMNQYDLVTLPASNLPVEFVRVP
ncbi:hypothetical protein [Noviherbaspirillum sp. ST9]|uniref:hypothetical protein n=1 Tax=Noviherbaspirillum sp. ST9 TaxID=3401606 RepID=UPI003B585E26